MKIIYGFSNCSQEKYENLYNKGIISSSQASQKYHHLLIEGLNKNGAHVYCFSGIPTNRGINNNIFINESDEEINNVKYLYYKTLNLPIIRQIMIFFGGLYNVLLFKRKDTFIICDCLSNANVYGMALAAKIKKIPIITIVTDLPNMQYNNNRFIQNLGNQFFKFVDGFVLLTEEMNNIINKKNKPYIVLEGHVDINSKDISIDKNLEERTGIRNIIYAGSLKKIYGIEMLVKGFLEANIPNSILTIYGNGDYEKELIEITKNYENVIYKGNIINSELIKIEQQAALLVNPRPTTQEFVKYSFPSKNMEYMVSGTPVLTTNLPGMPFEYHKYVYLLENETVNGIKQKLLDIFSRSLEERKRKGNNAKEWILKNKNNVQQAKKIINLIGDNFRI